MADLVIKKQSIAYPIRIYLGSLFVLEYPDFIGNQIEMFCKIVQGERPLIPSYGLPEIIFKKAISKQEILALVLANLRRFFIGVDITGELKPETIPGLIEIDLTYTVDNVSGTITIEI